MFSITQNTEQIEYMLTKHKFLLVLVCNSIQLKMLLYNHLYNSYKIYSNHNYISVTVIRIVFTALSQFLCALYKDFVLKSNPVCKDHTNRVSYFIEMFTAAPNNSTFPIQMLL